MATIVLAIKPNSGLGILVAVGCSPSFCCSPAFLFVSSSPVLLHCNTTESHSRS